MIEPRLADFVHAAPYFVLGTRDANLRPHGTHAMGAKMDAGAGLISVFVVDAMANGTLEDARTVRVAAVTCGENSHETYQFKGTVTDVHVMTPEEAAVMQAYFPKLAAGVKAKGLPIEQWEFPNPMPASTIVIRVTDIFVQTPGPKAGSRIGP